MSRRLENPHRAVAKNVAIIIGRLYLRVFERAY